MSDLKTVNGMEDLELKGGNQMMGEYENQNPTLKQTASLRSGEGQINGLTRGDSAKVRETAASRRDPSNDNLYVKAMKRIIYLSLVIIKLHLIRNVVWHQACTLRQLCELLNSESGLPLTLREVLW